MLRKLLAFLLLTSLMVLPAVAAGKKPARPAASGPVDGDVASYSDRVQVHYHAEGKGSPAVVFIHCWTGDSSFFAEQVKLLAPHYRVVTIDLPGHGLSGKDRKSWTMEAYGGDVKTVVEKLGLGKVILVGHSMGGTVIVEAAKMMRERVLGLIPIDTLQDVAQKWPADQKAAFLKRFKTDYPAACQYLAGALFPKNVDPVIKAKVLDKMTAAPPEIMVPLMEKLQDYDEAAGFDRISNLPIIGINGDLYPTNIDGNRKHAPKYDAVIIKGVGHYPMFERPEEFNQRLAEVVQKLAGR